MHLQRIQHLHCMHLQRKPNMIGIAGSLVLRVQHSMTEQAMAS